MWPILLTVVSIVAGIIVGWLIPWLDKIAYIYILHPETQVAQYVKYLLAKKEWKNAWVSLNKRGKEFDKLTTRGILFRLLWVVLAFFAVTSASGWFGKTMVLVLGARLLMAEWQEFLKDKAELKQKLTWQIKGELSDAELKLYLAVMTLLLAWLLRLYI